MTVFEAQDYLEREVQTLCTDVSLADNLIDKPTAYPCVVVEIEGSRLQSTGGGSVFTGEQLFSLWVLCAASGGIRSAREELMGLVEKLITIPRFFADEKVEYGNDVAFGTKVVLAKISGKVA